MPATNSAPSSSGAHQLTLRTASSIRPSRSARSCGVKLANVAVHQPQDGRPGRSVRHVEGSIRGLSRRRASRASSRRRRASR